METSKTISEKRICELCSEEPSKYCCPRCNILYCSLDCYKSEKHLQCSESFYRDCILSDLSSRADENDAKNKMMDILKRLNESNELEDDIDIPSQDDSDLESDDQEYIDLSERLSSLDLNNADLVWECLTNDERQEFESLLNTGDVAKFVQIWTPWWEHKKDKLLIEDLSESKTSDLNCPAIKADIKNMKTISTNKQPSLRLKFNITNVLAAYVVTSRHFNGEHQESCLEAVGCLINISANILTNTNYDNLKDSLCSVITMCVEKNVIERDPYTYQQLQSDVKKIIEGPSKEKGRHYIKSALSDIHKLFSASLKILKSNTSPKESISSNTFSKLFLDHNDEYIKPSKENLRLYMKKMDYYLSYVESYGKEFEVIEFFPSIC